MLVPADVKGQDGRLQHAAVPQELAVAAERGEERCRRHIRYAASLRPLPQRFHALPAHRSANKSRHFI